jgi:5-(carboxyamino)imidazole ribonucleotide mutase
MPNSVSAVAAADQGLQAKVTAFQRDLHDQAKAKGARLRDLTSP